MIDHSTTYPQVLLINSKPSRSNRIHSFIFITISVSYCAIPASYCAILYVSRHLVHSRHHHHYHHTPVRLSRYSIHWKREITLYQIPTILSVDAFFTHEVAVRDQGVVKYVGNATPDKVFIDSALIRSAPAALNRSGLGDILSCHTGLFDWRLAAKAGLKPKWNETLAQETQKRLTLVLDNAAEIRNVSDKGVTLLAETLNWIGHHCYAQGHPRFEEGSEHHLVYNLEYITGKHFIHGQAVCLGTYLMSSLQNNHPERMLETIREAGIDITPEALGVTWADIKKTLDTLTEFVRRQKLPYTILHEKEIPASLLENAKKVITI